MTTEHKVYTVRESFDDISYMITGLVKGKEIINIVCDKRGWRVTQSSTLPVDIQEAQHYQLCVTHVFLRYTEKRYEENMKVYA